MALFSEKRQKEQENIIEKYNFNIYLFHVIFSHTWILNLNEVCYNEFKKGGVINEFGTCSFKLWKWSRKASY